MQQTYTSRGTDYTPGYPKPHQTAYTSSTSSQEEKQIPYSNTAEDAVIGSLLLDREVITRIAPILEPADFFNKARGNIYGVAKELLQKGIPADLVMIKTSLEDLGLLGEGEGQVSAGYLRSVALTVPSPVHAVHYARKVHDYSCLRKIIQVGASITSLGYQVVGEAELGNIPDAALVEADRLLQAVRSWRSGLHSNPILMSHEATLGIIERLRGLRPGEDMFSVDPEELARIKKEKRNKKQVPLGWSCFDGITGEREPAAVLARGNFATVIAPPSVGKSTFLLHVADNAAMQGYHVSILYNELSEETWLYRRAAKLSGVRFSRIRREDDQGGVLSDDEWQRLDKAVVEMRSWPGRVDFYNVSGLSGKEIRDLAFEIQKNHMQVYGRPVDFFGIDYLGRMEADNARRYKDQFDYQAENVKGVAQIATKLKVPVMLMAQASRGDAKKGKMDMFSGALTSEIERCSQLIFTLEQAGDTKKREEPDDFVKVTIQKNTDGRRNQSFIFKNLKGRFDFQEVSGWEGFMAGDDQEKGGGEWDPEAEAGFETGEWRS